MSQRQNSKSLITTCSISKKTSSGTTGKTWQHKKCQLTVTMETGCSGAHSSWNQTSTFADLNVKITIKNEVQQPETTRAMPNTRASSRYRNKPNKSQELTLSMKPVTLHAAFAPMISRDQKGDPHLEQLSLSLHPAGILFPDQRVAAVLQDRLYPTMGRSCWWCRCCCCCRCCYCRYCCCCCCCHASASCCCSSGKPTSRRRFC